MQDRDLSYVNDLKSPMVTFQHACLVYWYLAETLSTCMKFKRNVGLHLYIYLKRPTKYSRSLTSCVCMHASSIGFIAPRSGLACKYSIDVHDNQSDVDFDSEHHRSRCYRGRILIPLLEVRRDLNWIEQLIVYRKILQFLIEINNVSIFW